MADQKEPNAPNDGRTAHMLSKVTLIREAHARGEGGYGTLARRFGVSKHAAKGYIQNLTDEQAADFVAFQQCGRKIKYDTHQGASHALSELVSKAPSHRVVYHCPRCNKFHFGRPTVSPHVYVHEPA